MLKTFIKWEKFIVTAALTLGVMFALVRLLLGPLAMQALPDNDAPMPSTLWVGLGTAYMVFLVGTAINVIAALVKALTRRG